MTHDLSDLIEQRTALLDAWIEKQRQIASLQAEATALLAQRTLLWDREVAMAPMHRDTIERSMISEFAAAGHLSKGSMGYAFADARLLADFPTLRASFGAGKITPMHVREVLHEARPVLEAIHNGTVDPETLLLYEAAVIEVAESDTSTRTRAHARQVAAALVGATVVDQHERAKTERKITVRSIGDGMALLQAVLPEHLALAIQDRLTKMARHMRQHPDDRAVVLPTDLPDDIIADLAREKPDFPMDDPGPRSYDNAPPGSRLADPPEDAGGESAGSQSTGSQRTGRESTSTIFGEDTFTVDPFHPCRFPPPERDAEGFAPDPWLSTDRLDMSSPYCETPDLPIPPDPKFHRDSPCIIHIPADDRTIDQLRADLFTDLLLTAGPSDAHGDGLEGIHATIQVTVAAATLAGDDDNPAELDGHGALHPAAARALAGYRTGWTRLFLDPTGLITETDTYTPTEPMRRYLRARDQRCRFPGCGMPVHRCEIDHNRDHAKGGPTSIDNLCHFCRRHHPLKHPDIPDEHRWTAHQQSDGSVVWASPNGRTYADAAPRRVMFVPSDETQAWPSERITAAQTGSPF